MTMNKAILFLVTIIPTFLFGQDVKKVTDKENHETFYVLKSDKTTKHGEYKKFSYKHKLLVRGFYKQGVKDSIWECYDLDGQLTLKYNYTSNQLIFHKPNDIVEGKKYKIINGNSGSNTTLTRPPIFLGGDDLMLSEIIENIQYPYAAKENGKEGTVNVLFTVDKYGKTSNFRVEKPLGYGMDEEAIRVLKLLPDNWLPGNLNGQPVDVEVSYPISYNLGF